MIIEVIATSITDTQIAERCGADRIELISEIMEGGLTPSYSLIESVLKSVRIPVHVMVRPHSNTFCYTPEDLKVMKQDIRLLRQLGASGIVLGVLTEEGDIDEPALSYLLEDVHHMQVTFHRAFDELRDLKRALHQLARYPSINRVLTSGGRRSALDAAPEIHALVEEARGLPITILAGSGLVNDKLEAFIKQTNVHEIHMGTGVRVNNQALQPIDEQKLQEAVRIKRLFEII